MMAFPEDSHSVASPPLASRETQETRSPDSIEPTLDADELLVNRLTHGLDQCDWDQLEERYADAMDEHSRVEEDLRGQTTKLLEVRKKVDTCTLSN